MRFTSLLAPALGAMAMLSSACDDTSSATDAGPATDAATTSTLYLRLGGNAGIASAVDAIVTDELADAEIAAYFAHAAAYANAPSAVQIKQCLVLQLGNAAGGPEQYPGTVSGGFRCRGMAESHAHLGITTASFDKFVMIAAATLTRLGVAPADITVIGGVLNGTKTDIAKGPTLYQRLGKKAGIAGAVDAIVTAELMDAEIAPFFAPNLMAAHTPSAVQVKECLVEQLGAASGGPEVYPAMVSGGFMCRSMRDAHSALPPLSGAVFDKFVMIAANTLTGLGVSADDVALVGGVLNGTKADVVH